MRDNIPDRTAPSFEHVFVATNGIRLHVAQAGPEHGPLLILLHGFPEFWYGWRKHISRLAASGFRVWAPDQRGYNLSDKPTRIRDYVLDQLVADVAGLIDAAGRKQAILVGHDWGGAVAWWFAANQPQRVERLVIINVPHPTVMRRLLLTSIRQLARSWYVFMIQIPRLPEWGSRRNHWHSVVDSMKASSLPDTFTAADFDEYRRAWSQPNCFRAMLNWYRAAVRYDVSLSSNVRITSPTLILWGLKDKFIRPPAADLSLEKCEHGKLIKYENNTHWLQHERPDEICQTIIEFCR